MYSNYLFIYHYNNNNILNFIFNHLTNINCFRDLQKLEGNLRSPMITHCNETISGLDTIRAFGKQTWFMSEMINRIDNHTKVFLIISSSNRWLGIALVSIYMYIYV